MFKTTRKPVHLLLILSMGLFSLTALVPATTSLSHAAPKTSATTAADGEAKAKDHDKEAKPELISVNPRTYLWQLIVFIVVFAFLAKFVWPVILKGIRDREAKIRDDLTAAENAANEAKATLEQYKQQLTEAHKEAQRIIEQSRKDAEQIGAQLKAQTEDDIVQMKERAQKDIQAAKDQAITDIFDQTATLATNIAGQILQREVRTEDHQQLVQASLNELNRN